ncbi:acyltransferase family protein [Roseateles sp. PN1]|uniref:acyltransferase family protein n=1 Tax=Roseateles sp. PN1 TaxID=3137372 RepID=UPI00313920F1
MSRLAWLDTAKGIGIIAVVAGHVFSNRQVADLIYLWHMPLFFFLSGYLFSPRPSLAFAVKKAKHLLVPYLAFLLVLSLPQLLAGDLNHVRKMIFGGRLLTGTFGTFWFIPVLFLTQQLANYLFPRLSINAQAALVAACIAVAALIPPGLSVPWALDVMLFTLPVFWLGTRCKGHDPSNGVVSAVGVIGLVFCATGLLPPLDLKAGQYGLPILTLTFSVTAVYLVCQVSRIQSPLSRPLQALGGASMTIMFLHQAVFRGIRDGLHWTNNETLLFGIALTVPFALHQLLARTALTRQLFLGEARIQGSG